MKNSWRVSVPTKKRPAKSFDAALDWLHDITQNFSYYMYKHPKRIPIASRWQISDHLLNHFKLATELGGEVIQVHSPHILESIIKVAIEKQITTICTGIPALKLPKTIFTVSKYKNFMKSLSENNIDLIILA